MRKLHLVGLFAILALASFGESRLGQSAPTTHAQPSGRVPVYRAGKDVTAPELIPIDFSNAITNDCLKMVSGDAELSFIVDASGHPRNIAFVRPIGNDLDKVTLVVLGLDRFKPGEQNGVPVAVGRSVKIKLDGCFARINDEADQMMKHLRLHSPPIQTIGAYPQSPTTAVLVAAPDPSEVSNADDVGGGVRPPAPIF